MCHKMVGMSVDIWYMPCFLIATCLHTRCLTHIHQVPDKLPHTTIRYSCYTSRSVHFFHNIMIFWIHKRSFINNFIYFNVQNNDWYLEMTEATKPDWALTYFCIWLFSVMKLAICIHKIPKVWHSSATFPPAITLILTFILSQKLLQ